MKYTFKYLSVLLVLISFVSSVQAGSWSKIKRVIQKNVQVIEETKESLVLFHPELQDTIKLSYDSASDADIIIDIIGAMEKSHGSNPYQVWVATERFWSSTKLPKSQWGQFFRAAFLKGLRPPETLSQLK